MVRRLPARCLLAAIAVLAVAPAAASAQLAEAPCGHAGFLCSRVSVPLDRSGRVPGAVSLDVRRLPAGPAPTRTAIVTLLGGPGQAATPAASELAGLLAPVRGDRDLLVFDERGIGGSGALRCPALRSTAGGTASQAQRCARELGRARGDYTSAASAEDVEAIRQAGGYDEVLLFGVSYGTKVALDYAAAHPDRVEGLVLDSIVPPEGPDPLQLSTFAAMPRVLGALCAGRACRHITARPTADVARLVRRLARHPMRGRFVTGTGRAVRVRLTPVSVLSVLLGGDLNPILRAETPAAVAAALHGDGAPLARLRVRAAGIGAVARAAPSDGVNETRYVATVCEEVAFPWDRTSGPVARARQATARIEALRPAQFAPFDRATVLAGGLLPLCIGWPVASPAPRPVTLPPDVPALLLTGQEDLRTPVEDARRVAARLGPSAQLVEVPNVGHSVLGGDPTGCATGALAAFLQAGRAAPCAPSRAVFAPTPIPPRRLSAVRPYPGLSGLPGRTLTATSRTVRDLRESVAADEIAGATPRRLGGLRGGTATAERGGVRLRRYSFVPGVELSGLVPSRSGAALRLRVTGSAAATGSFRVAGGRVSGRLGGRRFDIEARPQASAAAAPPRRAAPFPTLAGIG